MADKEGLESLTGIEQDVQITERTKHAMENYFSWFQNAMSASPWSNVDLNKKLLSYATENVTASVGLVQQLSQAKNLEELVKIQTEFVSKQLNSFHEQTKTMVEICTKAVTGRDEALSLAANHRQAARAPLRLTVFSFRSSTAPASGYLTLRDKTAPMLW
jgi:hypothetical protein